jgi:hypothetical protein
VLEWLQDNKELFYWLTGASAVMFAASLVAAPVVIVRLPADHFQKGRGRASKRPGSGAGSLALTIGRNVLGWLFIVVGLALLLLPGQGLLMVLVGVALADFPGKFRLQRWIISRKKILQTANWLRRKFGKPPLKV